MVGVQRRWSLQPGTPEVPALSLLFLLFLLVSDNRLNAQVTYSVTDLGPMLDLPARSDSGPRAINSSGSVVGANVSGNYYHAMVYQSGAWKDLGTLGGNESLAGGIDDAGRVAGYSQTSGGSTNAFLWTSGATDGVTTNPQMKSLGTLGGVVSQAYGINNAGQVSGYSDVAAHPAAQQHAFLYSAGTMTDIGSTLNQLPNSFGYTVNASGHVAGAAYDTAYSAPHALFYNGSSATDLGVFGGLGATVLTMNGVDNLAGYLTTTSSFDHAFSYIGGKVTDLGTLGGHYSYALGINNSNIVVGGSFTDSKDSIYHAFAWLSGTLVDLNTQLDQTGAGWTLTEARAINDASQITGVGTLGGVNHAFLLTPGVTTIAPAPQISTTKLIGSNLVFQFTTVTGRQYTLQTNGILSNLGWSDSSAILTASGGTLSVTNSLSRASHLFYRVKLF